MASSQKSTSGLFAKARAIAIRCFCPPDKVLIGEFFLSAKPTISKSSSTRELIIFFGILQISIGYAIFSPAVREAKSAKFWKIIPIFRRCKIKSSFERLSTLLSSYKTSPESGVSSKLISRTKEDLPAPLFPIIPKIVFEGICKLTSFTACTTKSAEEYNFFNFSNVIFIFVKPPSIILIIFS